MEKKKKFAVPHVYILLLGIILICSVLTYIVPAGTYDMETITMSNGAEREVVNSESFHNVDPTPVTLLQFLTAVPRGLQESAQIIFFIFIVGGTMTVVQETRAIEAGMGFQLLCCCFPSAVLFSVWLRKRFLLFRFSFRYAWPWAMTR